MSHLLPLITINYATASLNLHPTKTEDTGASLRPKQMIRTSSPQQERSCPVLTASSFLIIPATPLTHPLPPHANILLPTVGPTWLTVLKSPVGSPGVGIGSR